MNTWGVINSFGIFQTYYTTALNRPPSDISWIGSLQIFLLFFVGALTGRLTDAGYFRHVFVVGVAFQILGIFAASAATQYWQLVLAQGICVGLGNGFLFCPCISTLSTYFSKRRALAIALGACGSATGGLVFPGMVRQLLPAQGFPAAMRAIGYVQLATFAVALVGLKPRIPPRKSGPWVEWRAFREAEYTLYAAGSFSVSLRCTYQCVVGSGLDVLAD
jgi:MFS family permease